MSYEQQKELSRLPEKIHKAEVELEALQTQLADTTVMKNQQQLLDLSQRIETAKNKVGQLYHRWQELEE